MTEFCRVISPIPLRGVVWLDCNSRHLISDWEDWHMFFENGNSRLVRWLIFAAGFTALPFAAAALDYTQIDYPGADATVPLGINNRGDIVGLYRLGTSGHIFLLSSAGTFSNIDPPGAAS